MPSQVLVATPLVDGKGHREFINGLLRSQSMFYAWACVEGESDPSVARDLLAGEFLDSPCQTLVFIDGDVGFTGEDFERLLQAKRPLVSGLLATTAAGTSWRFRAESPPRDPDPAYSGLIPVRGVGNAFLRIDREVFQKLIDTELCEPYAKNGRQYHHFFRSGLLDGDYLHEDYFFSELARMAGFQPYVCPDIRLTRARRESYPGAS